MHPFSLAVLSAAGVLLGTSAMVLSSMAQSQVVMCGNPPIACNTNAGYQCVQGRCVQPPRMTYTNKADCERGEAQNIGTHGGGCIMLSNNTWRWSARTP